MKRIISYLLVFAILFSFMSVSVFAQGGTTRGGGAGRVVGELASGFAEYGGAYLDNLVSSGDAEEVDSNTFMGLSVPAYGSDFTIVSRYQPDDSDYLANGYYINVPAEFSGIARECIVDNTGIWHFTNFYGPTVYDCVSLYLDGTVATFACFYSSFDAYDVFVYDYSTYVAYTKIINLLSGIAENMGVVEGGSGDIDTSEMEDSLSSIDSSLSEVLTYLSALDQNVINTEYYLSELSTTLDNVSSDVSTMKTAVSAIGTRLNNLQPLFSAIANNTKNSYTELQSINAKITECMELTNSILTTISEDVGQIRDDVSESKGILSAIRDKIDGMHTAVVDKLDTLISAVRSIGSVSGGNSSGTDGSSFVGDLLGGIFGVAFEALKLLLNLVFNLLSSVFGFIARFSAFVTSLWSGFIPADILAILLVIPPLSFILGVIKFVRG